MTTEREFRQGTPYEAILDYVDEQDVDLVVMGPHGRAGVGPDLGSTTLRVIRNVDVPTLTVRFQENVDVDVASHYEIYDDILVATDGSDGAMVAAERGIDIAERYGATVHALYVVDTNTYAFEDVPRSIVGLLKESGNTALDEIAEMARELLDYVNENDLDLVTLGAHGANGYSESGGGLEIE